MIKSNYYELLSIMKEFPKGITSKEIHGIAMKNTNTELKTIAIISPMICHLKERGMSVAYKQDNENFNKITIKGLTELMSYEKPNDESENEVVIDDSVKKEVSVSSILDMLESVIMNIKNLDRNVIDMKQEKIDVLQKIAASPFIDGEIASFLSDIADDLKNL